MKNLRNISFLLFLFAFLYLLPANKIQAAEQTSEWYQYSNYYYYNLLTEEEQTFYNELDTMCHEYLENNTVMEMTSTKACNYVGLSLTDALKVANLFYYSNPQYYFLKNAFISNALDETSGTIAINVYSDFIDPTARMAATSALKSALTTYVSEVKQEKTLLKKEVKIHDLLISANSKTNTSTYGGSAYGIFIEQEASSQGYAMAFSMLLNASGIDAITLSSSSHAFNYIRLNSIWYAVDVYTDDMGSSSSYSCFNRSLTAIKEVSTSSYYATSSTVFAGYVPSAKVDSGSASATITYENTMEEPESKVTIKYGISTVTLTSTIKSAKFYYTTDGTEPSICSTKSSLYTSAFKTGSSNTVKVIAISDGYADSEIYTINISPAEEPELTETMPYKTYTYGQKATKLKVTATSADEGIITYQWYKNSGLTEGTATKISGATKTSYTPSTLKTGIMYYYCIAKNTFNGTTATSVSTLAKITTNKKSIATVTVSGIKNKAYTGSAIKQSFTVKMGSTTLKSGTHYTVSYSNNTKIGTASVILTGKGNFSGEISYSFKITPKSTTLKSVSSGYKKVTASWSKVSNATGYEIQYSASKSFSNAKSLKISNTSTVSRAITGLSSGKTYYVRIRAYKTVSGKTYSGSWSAVKSARA